MVIKKIRMRWYSVAVSLAVVGIVAILLGSGVQKPERKVPLVKVQTVKRENLTEELNLIGSVLASESVVIKSRLDSQIMDVFIKDGDAVKKGQRLFQLDDRHLQDQLKEAEATRQSNQAELVRAEQQYNRDATLSKKGVVAKGQYDRSLQSYEAAKAALSATDARLSLLSTQISYADIRSPIDGVVGKINITNGNVVKANDTNALVIINKIEPIYIDIALPQRYFWRVKDNSGALKARIQASEGTEITTGIIHSIDNALDVNSRTLSVRLSVENKHQKFWPGMFVDVGLDIRTAEDGIVIPLKAVQRTQQGDQVFKVSSGIAKLIPVTVLFANSSKVAVKAELEDGDQVVVEGSLNIRTGDKVKIATEAG